MYKLLFVVAALLPACLAQIGTVCPGGLPPPTSVVVDHCDAAPCDIEDGGTYSFTMEFTMGTASNQLTHYARAYVGGVDIGYEVPPALRDACNSEGISCPVAAGTQIRTPLTLTIDAPVTGVLAEIRYEMRNENGVVVVCWESTLNVA